MNLLVHFDESYLLRREYKNLKYESEQKVTFERKLTWILVGTQENKYECKNLILKHVKY